MNLGVYKKEPSKYPSVPNEKAHNKVPNTLIKSETIQKMIILKLITLFMLVVEKFVANISLFLRFKSKGDL